MTKKVWHLCSNRWNSAVTEYCLSTNRSLELAGWSNLLTALEAKPCAERANSYGLAVKTVTSFKLSALFQLLSIYRDFRPDLIIVYGGPETFLSKFFVGTPVVRFRGLDRDFQEPPKPLSYKLSQSHIRAVIAPSQTLAHKFKGLQKICGSVTLGVDTQKFHFDSSSYENQKRPVLTILGRLDPVKGHGAFFLWFSLLLRSWPEGTPKPLLKIIGEAANVSEEHLKGFAEDVGLVLGDDWLFINERLDDIAQELSSCHVGVICSQGSEVICRVAEEFLLCGAPIFVSGVGSLEDCLYDSDAGLSYRDLPGNEAVEALKSLLLASFNESTEARESRALRSKCHFSMEAMGSSLDQFLAQVGPSHLRGLEPSAPPTKP